MGFTGIGRSTVARILKRQGFFPRARRRGPNWRDFIGHYGQFIWAGDFFTLATATLRTYCVLFFIEIKTRRIVFWNVSEQPDDQWVAQQFQNLSIVHGQLPQYLLYDRDSKSTAHADGVLRTQGRQPLRLPVRSPNVNVHAE